MSLLVLLLLPSTNVRRSWNNSKLSRFCVLIHHRCRCCHQVLCDRYLYRYPSLHLSSPVRCGLVATSPSWHICCICRDLVVHGGHPEEGPQRHSAHATRSQLRPHQQAIQCAQVSHPQRTLHFYHCNLQIVPDVANTLSSSRCQDSVSTASLPCSLSAP